MVYESSDINSLRDEVVYKKGNKIYIDKKWLYKKYVEDGLSCKNIGKLLGISETPITRLIKECRIERKIEEPLYKNRGWLYQKYVEERLSSREIAKMLNVSQTPILYWLENFGINKRKSGGVLLPDPDLNEKFYEMFDGIMLGDGCLHIKKGGKNATFEFSQCEEHTEWIYKMKEIYDEYNIKHKIYNVDRKLYSGKIVKQYRIFTKAYNLFTKEYKRWYPSGKRIAPKDVRLSPISLAYWYIGDGNLDYNKIKETYQIRIGTYGFPKENVEFLINKLKEMYNLNFNIQYHKKSGGWYLQNGKRREVYKFCKIVEPYVLKCFERKIMCLKNERWLNTFL